MIHALISDLGNVLLHFDHDVIRRRLVEQYPDAPRNADTDAAFWKVMREFETGRIDTDRFFDSMAALLNVPSIDTSSFSTLWGDIFWPNTELLTALKAVSDRLTLVLLSNTNPLHITYVEKHFPQLFELFQHRVFSFEAGCAKPDESIYRKALQAAGCEAHEALYFDDIAAYVDAGSSLGLHAYQYVSAVSMIDVLNMYNLSVSTPASPH